MVVGLQVGVDRVGDAQVGARGRVEVLDDVQLRVYDCADPFAFSTEEIGCAPAFWPQELTKDHKTPPLAHRFDT